MNDATTDIALTIVTETPGDATAIERLHERTFGPGRYAKTAYRLREQVPHALGLSFTARTGTLLVGSVRLSPISIGEAGARIVRSFASPEQDRLPASTSDFRKAPERRQFIAGESRDDRGWLEGNSLLHSEHSFLGSGIKKLKKLRSSQLANASDVFDGA